MSRAQALRCRVAEALLLTSKVYTLSKNTVGSGASLCNMSNLLDCRLSKSGF